MAQQDDAQADHTADGPELAIDRARLEIERARAEAEISHLRGQDALVASRNEKAKLQIAGLKGRRRPGGVVPILKGLAVIGGVLAGSFTAWLGIAQLEEGRILKNED